ncbi:MAG: phage holin family protein [Parcubacteria group bacterium]
MYMILRWLINALGLLAIGYFVPGITVENFYAAMVLVVVIGLVNAVIGMVLKIITFPINIITLGISNLIINALIFWWVSTFIQGFEIAHWWSAVLGATLYTVISIFSGWLYKESYMH